MGPQSFTVTIPNRSAAFVFRDWAKRLASHLNIIMDVSKPDMIVVGIQGCGEEAATTLIDAFNAQQKEICPVGARVDILAGSTREGTRIRDVGTVHAFTMFESNPHEGRLIVKMTLSAKPQAFWVRFPRKRIHNGAELLSQGGTRFRLSWNESLVSEIPPPVAV